MGGVPRHHPGTFARFYVCLVPYQGYPTETVQGQDIRSGRLLFETCVDDYGEIWINGVCDRERGAVQGFNVPQRVVVTTDPSQGSSTLLLCSPSTALLASLEGESSCATRFLPSSGARQGTRAPVKYCPFPPDGGRLGWGVRGRDRRCKPCLSSPPPLPSPIKRERVCPYRLSDRLLDRCSRG